MPVVDRLYKIQQLEIERKDLLTHLVRCQKSGLKYTALFCQKQLDQLEIKIQNLKR